MITNQNIPKLRFKGFEGEWKEETLEGIAKIITGQTPPTSNRNFYGGSFLFVSPADFNGQRYISKTKNTCTKAGFDQVRKVNIKSVLFVCIGSTIGKIAQASEDCITNQQINSIFTDKNNSNDFLYYFLLKKNKKISLLAGKQAVPLINKSEFSKIKINFPSFPEQQKIADFLGKVDEWIEKLKEQKENLEKYKKGTMQKIFAQKIKFKNENGKEFEEWKVKKLGKICNITTGKLDANAMKSDGVYRFYTCAKDYFMIDKFAFDTEALLVSGNGANVGYIHYYNGKFNAYQRTYVLDKFTENILFIKYFLEENLEVRINNEKKEGNTPYIVLNTLSDMIVNCPDKQEQQKIAGFLTSIDKIINLKQEQIAKADEWKKGLMQRLFL